MERKVQFWHVLSPVSGDYRPPPCFLFGAQVAHSAIIFFAEPRGPRRVVGGLAIANGSEGQRKKSNGNDSPWRAPSPS
jgi:hypothetical protein